MTVKPLTIAIHESPSEQQIIVITGVRQPPGGDTQIFYRYVETGDPGQTTESFFEYSDQFEIVGHWNEDGVRTFVCSMLNDFIDPVSLVDTDNFPAY